MPLWKGYIYMYMYIWKEYMYIYTLNVFQSYIYDMNITCNKNTDAIISFSGSWYAMKKISINEITQLNNKQAGKTSLEIVICLCGYQVSAHWQNTWDNYHGGRKYLFLAHVLTSFRTLSIDHIASDLWYMMKVSRARESLPISP